MISKTAKVTNQTLCFHSTNMKITVFLITISASLVITIPPNPASLRDLCSNEDAELGYERSKFHELTLCLANVLNATEFRKEITEAGDTSKVNAVVTKVCKNLPEIVQCTNEYVSSIGPCMDQEEKREKELWKKLRQMNMEFACGDGKEHLIKFIDEGGIQCIATHRFYISECVNNKFPTLLKQQSDTQIVKTLAIITKEDGKCSSLKEVEQCVNSELMKCMDPSSLSIIRQYFSSLDVLFACIDNSTTTHVQDSKVSSERNDLESFRILSQIHEMINRLTASSEQRVEVEAATDRRILELLEQQTVMMQKMVNIVDSIIIPKLKKEKRKIFDA